MSEEINTNLVSDIKNYLTALDKTTGIEDYTQLGYTLKSVIKVTQTALLAEIEFPEWAEHTTWDIYNLLNLIKNLIPESEFELLDQLNKEPKDKI